MKLVLAIERTLLPLDQARRAWLRLVLQGRLLAAVLTKREHRFAALVSVHAPVACTLAVYLPVPLFILGPVVFGVAHIAADLRYLVLRRALPRWWVGAICVFSGALVLLNAGASLTGSRPDPRMELALGTLFALLGVAAAGADVPRLRAPVAAGAIAALGALALQFPDAARLALLHGHNLVALLLLLLLCSSRRSRLLAPLAVILSVGLALASGVFYRASLASTGVRAFDLHLLEVADLVAPGLRADFAIGLTTAFLFLQAAHYLTWLVVVPQREQRSEGTTTFRMSFRSLLSDFGPWGLGLVGSLTLLTLACAAFDAPRTQRAYLSLGAFHAYLELAMLAYLWVRREARR